MPAINAVPRMVLPENSCGNALISVANTNRDGTGTIVDLLVAGTKGSLIELIRAKAIAATTAGMVRLYIYNGAAWRLYAEMIVTVVTPTASVETWEGEFIPDKPLVLPTGYKIGAAPHNAESFHVFATGGDY